MDIWDKLVLAGVVCGVLGLLGVGILYARNRKGRVE